MKVDIKENDTIQEFKSKIAKSLTRHKFNCYMCAVVAVLGIEVCLNSTEFVMNIVGMIACLTMIALCVYEAMEVIDIIKINKKEIVVETSTLIVTKRQWGRLNGKFAYMFLAKQGEEIELGYSYNITYIEGKYESLLVTAEKIDS